MANNYLVPQPSFFEAVEVQPGESNPLEDGLYAAFGRAIENAPLSTVMQLEFKGRKYYWRIEPITSENGTSPSPPSSKSITNHRKNRVMPKGFDNAIDVARELKILTGRGGLTTKEAGKKFDKSASWVRDQLRLLSLPIEVQEMIKAKRLKSSNGRALVRLQNNFPGLDCIKYATMIIDEGWKTAEVFSKIYELESMGNVKKNHI